MQQIDKETMELMATHCLILSKPGLFIKLENYEGKNAVDFLEEMIEKVFSNEQKEFIRRAYSLGYLPRGFLLEYAIPSSNKKFEKFKGKHPIITFHFPKKISVTKDFNEPKKD